MLWRYVCLGDEQVTLLLQPQPCAERDRTSQPAQMVQGWAFAMRSGELHLAVAIHGHAESAKQACTTARTKSGLTSS